MNQTSDPTPDFEIEFRADEMEPHADVVPAGAVTFQLINATDDPQDFALLEVEQDEAEWRDAAEPVTEGDIQVVGVVRSIPAWGAAAVTWELEEGHYVMISNTPGERLHASLFELTVQPVHS
ncbi:MAG: hypothetical protein AB7F65_09410 [Dehalococcoidia bacterium]